MNFMNAANKYRRERWLYLHHLKLLAHFYCSWIYLIHNSYIPPTCSIGKGTVFAYKGIGVIIHANAVVGDNCTIGSNVTIGGGAGGSNKKILEYNAIRKEVPVIGNRVEIATGAKVLGNIVVGDDVIIGANAVVINDVPSKAVVGGVPAKILYMKIELDDKENRA